MKMNIRIAPLALCCAAMVISGGARAAEPDSELAALEASLPGELMNDPRMLVALMQYEASVKAKVVKSDDVPGGAALQIALAKAPDQAWKVGANTALTQSIAAGEMVTIGFYARALPGADGNAAGHAVVRIQQNSDPWPSFINKGVDIESDWQWHEVSAVATAPMSKGDASIIFTLGHRAQTLEIGQVIAVKGAKAIVASTTPTIELPPELQKVGGTLINRPDGGPWLFYGTGGSQTRIDDKGIFTGKATRVTVDSADGQPWDLATGIPLATGIKEGDRLLVAMALRTVSAEAPDGLGTIGVRFQSTDEPWPSFANNVIHPGTKWQLVQLRTTAGFDIPEGKAGFSIVFGGTRQVIDVGPVYILKLD